MISDDLYAVINKKYPNRDIEIEVSEDGENGSPCILSKDKKKLYVVPSIWYSLVV